MSLLIRVLLIAAFAAAAVSAYLWWADTIRDEGRAEVRAEWTAAREIQKDAAIAEAARKAAETERRLKSQQENQRAQDEALAAVRADRDRLAARAERLQRDHAAAARDWSSRLADSPTGEDLAAAASAIGVCTQLLGRARARAQLLAGYSDTARAHGLKCEADYDALIPIDH